MRLEAILPTLVFLMALGLFGIAALWQGNDIQAKAQAQIQRSSERVATDVSMRFIHPRYGLNGAKGMYAASHKVSRAAFRAYVESHNLPEEFPGVRGLGFIQRVMRPDLDAFVAAERDDAAPQFVIHQLEDKGQADLYVIKLIEPLANNIGVPGLDIGSEPALRNAAQLAVDTGEPTMSAPVTLNQEQHKRSDVLLFMPVYAVGARIGNVSERRAALQGLLYAPIVIEKLLQDLPDVATGRINLELFDITEAGNNLMFNSDLHAHTPDTDREAGPNHLYSATQSLALLGRKLSLRVNSEPGFNASLDRSTPWLILATGTVISALLAFFLRSKLRQIATVIHTVDQRTRDLGQKTKRLQIILETVSDGIYVLDAEGLLIEANPAFLRMLGLDESALGSLRVNDWDLKFDATAFRTLMTTLITTQTSVLFEVQYQRQDGQAVDVEINARSTEMDGRHLMYCAARDISERKRSEKLIQKVESLLRTSVEIIDEAFVIFDPEDRLVYCNDKYRQIYAGNAHLIVPGVSFETLLRAGAKLGRDVDSAGDKEAWIQERLAVHRASESTLIQHLENGHILRIVERKTPDGHVVGFRVDITELYLAKEAAEAANIAKSRFLATMSHEIRTPMNAILGMAQVVMRSGVEEAERLESARTIYNTGQALLKLLNDILDLSKIEAGRIELESIPMSPAQLIGDTRTLFARLIGDKGLQIETSWHGSDGLYLGDPHRLSQMLANLVSNALKFTLRGSIRIEGCEVASTSQTTMLEFSVHDTGIGIPADKQGLLFLPFSQADSSTTRNYGGTGLGLSIVRMLAQAMGGAAGVESVAGRGSRFWFRVLARRLDPDADTRQRQRPDDAGVDMVSTSTVTTEQAVDAPRVIALMRALEPLLAHNQFDAIERFRVLQAAVAGTELAEEIAEAGRALALYQFELALARLRQIMQARSWEGGQHD